MLLISGSMKIETIFHDSGNLLPLLLGSDGMPVPAANEFIISRRALSPNTLTRYFRELYVVYILLEKQHIELDNPAEISHLHLLKIPTMSLVLILSHKNIIFAHPYR